MKKTFESPITRTISVEIQMPNDIGIEITTPANTRFFYLTREEAEWVAEAMAKKLKELAEEKP